MGQGARPPSFVHPLAALRAEPDRVFDITVCLRPFRAQGPRLDAETVGEALVVHNYGHGGSGWSLSWGSSALAVGKAMAASPREVAVIGCGALGLTSAILAQQAGARVTLYAREPMPLTRSFRATGSWTPDSRIALTTAVDPTFPALWEGMARAAFKTWRGYLGLPGEPVRWSDRYYLSDGPGRAAPSSSDTPPSLPFASYIDRIPDLWPHARLLPAGETPFPTPIVRRVTQMQFNIAALGHLLMSDFLAAGGVYRRIEFHAPGDLGGLNEKVVINCPGYGARSLMGDASITPVRGQIGWLIPQPEVDYGLYYRGISMLSRTDGVVVQDLGIGDMEGYGDDNETPDRAAALRALSVLTELYARFPRQTAA